MTVPEYANRLNDATYTSPSGRTAVFDFEELSREVAHRIGTFQFSGVNGTLHQDRGVNGEVYPLTIYLHGQDYDKAADDFFDMAKEIGPGYLNHPRWGRRRVQILSVSQDENLVTSGGQARLVVQFQETLEREFPKTAASPQAMVAALADAAQADAIANYAEQVDISSVQQAVSLAQDIIGAVETVKGTLENVASLGADVAGKFRGYIDTISNNISDMVQYPYEFATNITSAIRVVAEVPGRISSKMQGFQNMIDAISLNDIINPGVDCKNCALVNELIGTMGVVGASESVNNGLADVSTINRNQAGKATITVPDADTGFQTRGEVLAAVNYIQQNANTIINYCDTNQGVFEDNILSESYIQTVQSYVPVWMVAGTVIKAAIDISFTLPVKRTKVLASAKTILDLCYEFYRNIDDATLDYFILTNGLAGDTIIQVPMGMEVVFYE